MAPDVDQFEPLQSTLAPVYRKVLPKRIDGRVESGLLAKQASQHEHPFQGRQNKLGLYSGINLPADRSVLDPRLKDVLQPNEMLFEKPGYCVSQALRQDVAFAGHYAAKTPLILPKPLEIKPCIGGDPRNPRRAFFTYCCKRGIVALLVCADECGPKVLLRRKVMVNARLADADGFCEIRIAKTGITACSDQKFRFREQAAARVCPDSIAQLSARKIVSHRLAIDGEVVTY
jgi:hypothetical protein